MTTNENYKLIHKLGYLVIIMGAANMVFTFLMAFLP